MTYEARDLVRRQEEERRDHSSVLARSGTDKGAAFAVVITRADQEEANIEFLCITCGAPVRWNAEEGWFHCPECLLELIPDEARELADRSRKTLKMLVKELDILRGKSWIWRKLFG